MPVRLVMVLFLVSATALLTPAAKAADFCEEAWVLRNMIFDRLGYCFGSVTGQMMFDNADCTGKDVKLDPQQTSTVAFIREGETHVGCKINTSKPPSADMQRVYSAFSNYVDLPAPDYVGGYACWGYRGPAFELRAGASASAPLIGNAQTGQSVVTTYYSHYPGWQFYDIVTGPAGDVILSGWATGIDIGDANCETVAG
ncbi:MAG: YARHG domain-containing protein [Pseudomonadota bacterium]